MKTINALILLIAISGYCQYGCAQEDELQLIETVGQLQKSLDADQESERDDAESKLIGMGVEILDYLRPADENSTTDYRQRLARIRKALEKNSVNSIANASRVTIKGSMTVGEALKKIRLQTGNDVQVETDSIADQEVTLDIEDQEFWSAVGELMSIAKLAIDRYGSEKPNQLMLTPTQNPTRNKIPTRCHARIFQTEVTRVDSSINLNNDSLDFTSINLMLRWEPRLRPISVDVPLQDVKIMDEFDETIDVPDPNRVLYGTVQPEIPEVEFQLQIPRVDRQIENLKSLKAKIVAVIPGRAEQFRFENVSKLSPGYKLTKAGAVVRYGGTKKNEDLYGIKLSLSFDEENNALESHQGWVFQNEVYLQDRQGNREEALSLESFQQDNEMVTIQYYFLKDPGDRTLVYKTPATIVKMPVNIELKKIPMP